MCKGGQRPARRAERSEPWNVGPDRVRRSPARVTARPGRGARMRQGLPNSTHYLPSSCPLCGYVRARGCTCMYKQGSKEERKVALSPHFQQLKPLQRQLVSQPNVLIPLIVSQLSFPFHKNRRNLLSAKGIDVHPGRTRDRLRAVSGSPFCLDAQAVAFTFPSRGGGG